MIDFIKIKKLINKNCKHVEDPDLKWMSCQNCKCRDIMFKLEEKLTRDACFVYWHPGFYDSGNHQQELDYGTKEKLNNALLRPGRIDRSIELTYVDHNQTSQLFKKFFPQCNGEADNFAQISAKKKITPAEIQEYLLIHKESMDSALINMDNIVQ